eukprot:420833_1
MAVLFVVFVIFVNPVLSIIANPPICNSIEFEWYCVTGLNCQIGSQYQSTQPVNVCIGGRTSGVGHSTMYYCQNNHVWRKQWDSSETCVGTPYRNELMSDVITNDANYVHYVEECDLELCNYVKISVFSEPYQSQSKCERGNGAGDYQDQIHINHYCIGLIDYQGSGMDYSLLWDCDTNTNLISQNGWTGVSDCSTSSTVYYDSSIGNGVCDWFQNAYNYKNIECATATPFPTAAPTKIITSIPTVAPTNPVTSQPTTTSTNPPTSQTTSTTINPLTSPPTLRPFTSNPSSSVTTAVTSTVTSTPTTQFPTTASTNPPTSQTVTPIPTATQITNGTYTHDEPQNDFKIENRIVWIIVASIGCCLLLAFIVCVYKNKSGYSVLKKASISSVRLSTMRSVSTASTATTAGTMSVPTNTPRVDSGEGDDDVFGEGNTNDMDEDDISVVPLDNTTNTTAVPMNETYTHVCVPMHTGDANVLTPDDNEGN